MKRILLIIIYLLLQSIEIFSSTTEYKSFDILKTDSEIKIDGVIDKNEWLNATVLTDFFLSKPYDTTYAKNQTVVHLTYNDEFLLIAVECFGEKEKFIVQSQKRDFSFPSNEAFQVTIDPFNDLTNGFSFGVNAYGAQREGMISNGGVWGVSTDWDAKWYSKTKIYADRWVVEMAIPFKSIRFKEGSTQWKINFSRNDLANNQTSTWNKVPLNFNVAALAYSGIINFDKPLKKSGGNFSIIPYITGSTSNDFLDTTTGTVNKGNAGVDFKIAVTSSLNLDLTINPDFSQVEADQQVTNISRFSIFYPEKRQFFIENFDLFGRLGFSRIRPFFSRNIGLARNPVTGIYEQIPIIAGARLSGKLNKDWRVGLLNITTPFDRDLKQANQNYTVGVVQRQIGAASNLTFHITNKQALSTDSTSEIKYIANDFNRVFGMDYNFRTKDNKWTGIAFYHQSFTPNVLPDQGANATFLRRSTKKWYAMWNHEYVGENYNAEVGFVPRTGYWRFEPETGVNFFPKAKFINQLRTELYADFYFDKNFKKLDQNNSFEFAADFNNTSAFEIQGSYNYTYLFFDFDPSGVEDTFLLEGTDYEYLRYSINYESDQRKKLTYYASFEGGEYYNGLSNNYQFGINYRIQPIANISLNIEQININLPDPYSDAAYTLFGPKVELSLSTKVFWSTYVQYSSQQTNLNINSRFQWRFKPLSDLFIVYTDNYAATSNFNNFDALRFSVDGKRNRTLVFKLVYWFSV
ncbi:MAG: hypothetical protein Kow0079_02440 [Vicingaceae bacterium]